MPMNASNSPEPGHAPKRTKPTRLSIWWILGAIALGVGTGAIGTILHLNSWWTGNFGLIWGVALALVIVALAQWWIGLRTANMLASGITGIAQYVTVALMVTMSRGNLFSVPINAQTWEFVPHLVIAAVVWHLGIIVVTFATVVGINRTLRRARNQLTAEYIPAHSARDAWHNR